MHLQAIRIAVYTPLPQAQLTFGIESEELIATVAMTGGHHYGGGRVGAGGVQAHVLQLGAVHLTPGNIGRKARKIFENRFGVVLHKPVK